MAKLDFSALNKQRADSFQQQRQLIKRVLRGERVVCQECQQSLSVVTTELEAENLIKCVRGCTSILLQFGLTKS